jgi:hypothetical protein
LDRPFVVPVREPLLENPVLVFPSQRFWVEMVVESPPTYPLVRFTSVLTLRGGAIAEVPD